MIAAALTLAWGLTAAPAAANETCAVRIKDVPGIVRIGYDPFNDLPARESFEVALVNDGDEACSVQVRLEVADGGDLAFFTGGGRLPFRIFDARRLGLHVSGAPVAVDVSVPGNGVFRLPLRVELEAGRVLPPGSAEARLRVNLEGLPGREPDTEDFILVATIASRAQVSIGGDVSRSGGARFAVLDLGDLRAGASGQAHLAVRANTSVQVTVRSENRGALAHEDLEAFKVPYSLVFDGAVMNASEPLMRLSRRPGQTLDGDRYSVTVQTAPTSTDMPAGRYSDILTISVVPE